MTVHINHAIHDATFDVLIARIEPAASTTGPTPRRSQTGINHNHGGRGVYFLDPAGNYLEAITRTYRDD